MPISRLFFTRTTQILLAVGFLLLLAIGATSIWLVQQNRELNDLVSHTEEVRTTIARLRATVQTAETGQRGYLLTGDPSYRAPYDEAIVQTPVMIDRLSQLTADNARQQRRLGEMSDTVRAKFAELAETVELAERGERDKALDIVRSDRGRTLMARISTLLDDMRGDEDRLLAVRNDDADSAGRVLVYVTILGGIGVVLVGAGSIYLGMRYTGELNAAQAELARINADLDRTVQERTAELRQANEEIQRFAYIVSHDLRSPLVNVMGFTGEIEASLADLPEEIRAAMPPDIAEAISFIRSATDKMDRLINAILRLSREGRRSFRPVPLDMGVVLDEIAAPFRHRLAEAGGEIVVEPGLPTLIGDRLAIEQVFGNLIDNAVKYLQDGRPGRIVLRGRRRGSLAVFEVEDNGRGIEAKDAERIFEPFRRAGLQDRPGDGIGLAHVRTLLRRLGGTISCISEPGKGSVFHVTMPTELKLMEEAAA